VTAAAADLLAGKHIQRARACNRYTAPYLARFTFRETAVITLSESAKQRALHFTSADPQAKGLRFGVKKMGCSGWAYEVGVAHTLAADDHVFNCDGVSVVVDAKSLPIVSGTEIDFQRQGLNAQFVFNNPRVTAACGCGESFSVEREAI
jgi:iron-sulfur cluster assembly protein